MKSAYRYKSGSSLHYPFKDYKELLPLLSLLPKQLPADLLHSDGFSFRAAANFSMERPGWFGSDLFHCYPSPIADMAHGETENQTEAVKLTGTL